MRRVQALEDCEQICSERERCIRRTVEVTGFAVFVAGIAVVGIDLVAEIDLLAGIGVVGIVGVADIAGVALVVGIALAAAVDNVAAEVNPFLERDPGASSDSFQRKPMCKNG